MEGEFIVALHPTRKDPQTARRRLADLVGGDGQVTFELPLDVVVTVTFGKEKKTATCTGASPRQTVGFGGLAIKQAPTAPIKK